MDEEPSGGNVGVTSSGRSHVCVGCAVAKPWDGGIGDGSNWHGQRERLGSHKQGSRNNEHTETQSLGGGTRIYAQ